MLIWIGLKAVSVFVLSRFFLAATFDFSSVNSAPVHCSQVPQITLFSNFFIKNGSHNTIYTFKNYFATVFSVSAKISCIQTDPVCLDTVYFAEN